MILCTTKAKCFLSAVLTISLALSVPVTTFAEGTEPLATSTTEPPVILATEPTTTPLATPAAESTTTPLATPAAESTTIYAAEVDLAEENAPMLLSSVPRATGVAIDVSNFPDAVLLQYVKDNFDGNKDNVLDADEIDAATAIYSAGSGLCDLTGIEYLTKLEVLYVNNNNLTQLDVSGCTGLKWLELSSNELTSLNVSGCTALENLDANYNKLTQLDVSSCAALKRLGLINNQLTNLDVSKCTGLKELSIYGATLTDLDASGCAALESLNCSGVYGNQGTLVNVNASGCTGLKQLDLSHNKLINLNVRGCTALTKLAANQNELTTLDVSSCMSLKELNLSNNNFSELNVSGCTALEKLEAYHNKLTQLDASGRTNLKWLMLSYNELADLEVSGCTALENLDAYHNKLTQLDVSECTNLAWLRVSYNGLTSLNVSGRTALEKLEANDNKLTQLEVSGCTGLKELILGNNQLTNVDVHECARLKGLHVSGNLLTELDTSGCVALESLNCSGGNDNCGTLISVNVIGCTSLKWLGLSNNELTSLNLSGCTELEKLDAYHNKLTRLDVTDCTGLRYLLLSYNELSALDVSDCENLDTLYAYDNRISAINLGGNPNIKWYNLSQNIIARAHFVDGEWQVKMADVVGAANVANVSTVNGANYTNGIVSLGNGVAPNTNRFDYVYETKPNYGLTMPVAVNVDYDVEKIETEVKPDVVVSTELGTTSYNTAEKIVAELSNKLTGFASFPVTAGSNLQTMEVNAYLVTTGGKVALTAANMPASGVEVVLPYPTGTNGDSFVFIVAHMKQTGAVEQLTPTPEADGIHVTVHSLSPFGIAWEKKPENNDNNDNNDSAPAATAAPAAPANTNDPSVYYNIKTWVTTGGVISPSASVQEGGNTTITVTPAAGYRLVKLVVDGVDVGAVTSYTLNNVQRNHEIGAYFDKATGTTVRANGTIPQTSDEAPLLLWVCLMALALVGVSTLIVVRRRKHSK